MNSTKLSICIATYNRADYIGETLESILPQLTEAVEVVIVDGASTDNTGRVIKRYAERCPNIKYVLLSAKGGVDKDYDLAAEYAKGEYCWFFTDDDVINTGGIQAVLAQLEKSYPLIIVNASVKDSRLENLLEEKRLPVTDNVIYAPADFDTFFADTASYMSFIGCVVIQRSIWMERERAEYYGYEFVHLGVIFQKPLMSPVLVIAEPYISIRLGNAQWTSRAFEIWMFKWPKLIWGFNCLSDMSKSKITSQEPWRNLKVLAFLRAEGNFTISEYHRFIKPRMRSFSLILTTLLVLIPERVLNLLATIYYSIKTPRSKRVFFALRSSRCYWLNFAWK